MTTTRILSILKDIASVSLQGVELAGEASPAVAIVNPVAGAFLAAIAATAAKVETAFASVGTATPKPADLGTQKKTVFEANIAAALTQMLGRPPTPQELLATGPAVDSLIALANSMVAATKPPTQGISPEGIDATPKFGNV